MTVQWWLAKHMPDPARGEPVNVGLIVSTERDVWRRFVGEQPRALDDQPNLDLRTVRGRVEDTQTYRLWVSHWYALLPEQLTGVLDTRSDPWDLFYLQHAGEAFAGPLPTTVNDLDVYGTELYSRLVMPAPQVKRTSFPKRVGEIRRRVEHRLQRELIVNYTVKADDLQFPFDFAALGDRPIVVKGINLEDARAGKDALLLALTADKFRESANIDVRPVALLRHPDALALKRMPKDARKVADAAIEHMGNAGVTTIDIDEETADDYLLELVAS